MIIVVVSGNNMEIEHILYCMCTCGLLTQPKNIKHHIPDPTLSLGKAPELISVHDPARAGSFIRHDPTTTTLHVMIFQLK